MVLDQVNNHGKNIPTVFKPYWNPEDRPVITPEVVKYFHAYANLSATRRIPEPILLSEMSAYISMVGIPCRPQHFISVIQALEGHDMQKWQKAQERKAEAAR